MNTDPPVRIRDAGSSVEDVIVAIAVVLEAVTSVTTLVIEGGTELGADESVTSSSEQPAETSAKQARNAIRLRIGGV